MFEISQLLQNYRARYTIIFLYKEITYQIQTGTVVRLVTSETTAHCLLYPDCEDASEYANYLRLKGIFLQFCLHFSENFSSGLLIYSQG